MQQFIVPQFIDVEDKIIGPVTVRQFIMTMAAGLLIFLEFRFFDFSLFLISGILTLGLLILFAFVKVNGRPSYYFLLNIIETFKKPQLRVWKKIDQAQKEMEIPKIVKVEAQKSQIQKTAPQPSELAKLALLVDTGGLYGVEGENRTYG